MVVDLLVYLFEYGHFLVLLEDGVLQLRQPLVLTCILLLQLLDHVPRRAGFLDHRLTQLLYQLSSLGHNVKPQDIKALHVTCIIY